MRTRFLPQLLGTAALTLTLIAAPRAAQADGSWLDAPLVNWNTAGARLPLAQPEQLVNPECTATARPIETNEDAQVKASGWSVVGTYESGWGVRSVLGTSSWDGMCRPLGYQQFIFVNGTFAGTISPVPMVSRFDGASSRVFITPPAPTGGAAGITASFLRYTDKDPLCCASSTSGVTYRIENQPRGPVLVPVSAFTSPNN